MTTKTFKEKCEDVKEICKLYPKQRSSGEGIVWHCDVTLLSTDSVGIYPIPLWTLCKYNGKFVKEFAELNWTNESLGVNDECRKELERLSKDYSLGELKIKYTSWEEKYGELEAIYKFTLQQCSTMSLENNELRDKLNQLIQERNAFVSQENGYRMERDHVIQQSNTMILEMESWMTSVIKMTTGMNELCSNYRLRAEQFQSKLFQFKDSFKILTNWYTQEMEQQQNQHATLIEDTPQQRQQEFNNTNYSSATFIQDNIDTLFNDE